MNDRIKILIALVMFTAVFLLVQWLKQKQKDRLPTIAIRATIQSKSVFARSVNGAYGSTNHRYCRIFFLLADGSSIELNTPEELYRYPDGTAGRLVFQGEKFERFDPDEARS